MLFRSKSGIAILPSKRTRKIPEVKKIATTEVDEIFEKVVEPFKKEEPTQTEEPLTLKEESTEQ